jgi:ribonuclease J
MNSTKDTEFKLSGSFQLPDQASSQILPEGRRGRKDRRRPSSRFDPPSSYPGGGFGYSVRFVPLGGIVGVTKNMYVYELYENENLKDILIVDCGMGFPSAHELGVDLIIPDISYLLDKKDKIRAILLTHGHEDHIGALPYHYQTLGSPPLFTAKLTAMFIEKKLEEYEIRANVQVVKRNKEYVLGKFRVRFIHTCHSIPDTCHIIIDTPIGRLYHGQDFKMDLTPKYGEPPDFYEMCKAGNEGVLCLMSDALGAFREGLTLSESVVGERFEDEMRKTRGKFIMTTFASNISRIRQCADAAVKFNRKVFFLGRTMLKNTEAAAEINYLPIPQKLLGDEQEIMRLPPNKVCIIATGAQGQEGSAISKMAQNQHRSVKIHPGDTVFFSSDPIPGNEEEVHAIIEQLSLRGANVIYSDVSEQIHASGHGNIDDLKLLLRFTKPKFMIPIGSTIRHHMRYQEICVELGHKKEDVFLLNEGETVVFTPGGKARLGETIETESVYVDAYGVGDVGNTVLRDRRTLASDGIVVALVTIDRNAAIVGEPRLVSRGFVYEKTEGDLFMEAGDEIKKYVSARTSGLGRHEGNIEIPQYKKEIVKILERFFKDRTGRTPLVVSEVVVL